MNTEKIIKAVVVGAATALASVLAEEFATKPFKKRE